jgi:hypothetical protein
MAAAYEENAIVHAAASPFTDRHRLDAILTGCGKPWGGSHRCNFGYLAFSVYVWLRPHDNAAGPSPSNARSLAPQRYCVATMMPPQMAASPPPR